MLDYSAAKHSASLQFSPNVKQDIKNKVFDRLRIKTKLFTKEYNNRGMLLTVEPFFMDVHLAPPPSNALLLQTYALKTGAVVSIYELPGMVGYFYHLTIPETRLSFLQLYKLYKQSLAFQETGIAAHPYIKRWFLEFGVLEHLLFDDKVLEININPPAYKTSIRIVHSDFEECVSNIFPTDEMLNYLATRLKISTGRPLNKAQPQLDGEITVEEQRARVAAVIPPFSTLGIGYSIRKHREKPWTLPLFMHNRTVNHWYSGLLSLAVAHGRTFMVAGPRGSGKTSMLGSLILEILPKYRIIVIEDTAELPINSYKQLGYDVLHLKVRSALLQEGMEIPFDTGLRTSLRLGDSSLILGEVRSTEARVLYEAMRVGAMSNTVAGTIHADNPYGVYDRVVNDLGVPKGSFKVTDLIIIENLIKTPTGLSRKRRVTEVVEVLKDWEDKPKFQTLLLYNPKTDQLEPSDELLNGKSVTLKHILKTTEGYDDYNSLLVDLQLRGWAKQLHTTLAGSNTNLLEADFNAKANNLFAYLFEDIKPLSNNERLNRFLKNYKQQLRNILGM